jgi:hypothetical protein
MNDIKQYGVHKAKVNTALHDSMLYQYIKFVYILFCLHFKRTI